MKKLAFIIFLVLSSFVFCAEQPLPKPIKLFDYPTEVKNHQLINYGVVGPGQTFVLKIDPIVRDKNGNFLGQWDKAQATKLPENWTSTPSKLYANPLIVEITPSKDAQDGEYEVEIKLVDETGQEKIGDEFVFWVKVKIDHNVVEANIDPIENVVSASQPARFRIEIKNTGSAKDVFLVQIKGIKEWEMQQYVYIPSKESKVIIYEVVSDSGPTSYTLNLEITSLSSAAISTKKDFNLIIKNNLISDLKAVNKGPLLFPSYPILFYSVIGFLSNLFS
jgi:uncharacterized membrane protein